MLTHKRMQTKKQILNKAKRVAKINGLSDAQIVDLVNNNRDVDFLDDEIQKMMLLPDINVLCTKFLPRKSTPSRSLVSPEDVLKASIVGDIIGSRFEFTEHDAPSELLDNNCFFTDDTVLSIATASAVADNPQNPNFKAAYIDAYKKHPNAGYGSGFVLWAQEQINCENKPEMIRNDQSYGYGSFANGSAMRISFIPAYYERVEDVIRHTINSAIVTHNHIDGVKGAVVLSVCIWMAINGYSKKDIYKYCIKHYSYKKTQKELLFNKCYLYDIKYSETVSSAPQRRDISLYCNYAVPFVIDVFWKTDSYDSCMRKILSTFNDSDTLCAMAGGLCYAYYKTANIEFEAIMKRYNVPFPKTLVGCND